jgi:hypothetical protein
VTAGVRSNDSYLGAKFRRFHRRFCRKVEGKAIFACAQCLVVMTWHVLADDDAVLEDLGADWFERGSDTAAHTRRLVRELETFGHRVTSNPQPDREGTACWSPPGCRGCRPDLIAREARPDPFRRRQHGFLELLPRRSKFIPVAVQRAE